jgi:hypothetical protein
MTANPHHVRTAPGRKRKLQEADEQLRIVISRPCGMM